MKNSLTYRLLWQKLRNDIPVQSDVQQDWLQMQAVLDKQMPVQFSVKAKPSTGGVSFNWLMALVGTAVVAALVWHYVHHHKTVSQKPLKQQKEITVNPRSMPNTPVNAAEADSDEVRGAQLSGTHSAAIKTGATAELTAVKNDGTASAPSAGISTRPENDHRRNETSRSGFDRATGHKADPHPITSIGVSKPAANRHGFSVNVTGTHSTNNNLAANLTTGGHPIIRYEKRAGRQQSNNHNPINSPPGNIIVKPDQAYTHQQNKNYHASRFTAAYAGNTNSGNPVTQHNRGFSQRDAELFSKEQPGDLVPINPPPSVFNPLNGEVFQKRSVLKTDLITANSLITVKGSKSNRTKKEKSAKDPSPGKLDYGIFVATNSSGSFTPKNQNSNFYGSQPVDVYLGAFATYNLNDRWAVGSGVSLLNPQNISGKYTHANGSKVDSNQMLSISDSRKIYSVNVPLHVVYRVNNNLSVKGGPVFSIPVKQINGVSTLQPAGIRTDSAYYSNTISTLKSTNISKGLNYGISGGASYQFNRILLEATYLKSIKGPKVSSGFGSYQANYGTLQFSIGFQIDKVKTH